MRNPERAANRPNNATSGVLNGFVCMSNYRKHNFKPGCVFWLTKNPTNKTREKNGQQIMKT